MAKTTLVLKTCDRCGYVSMTGDDLHSAAVSAPGRLSTAVRWDLCGVCVDEIAAEIARHPKEHTPVEVTV